MTTHGLQEVIQKVRICYLSLKILIGGGVQCSWGQLELTERGQGKGKVGQVWSGEGGGGGGEVEGERGGGGDHNSTTWIYV